MKKLFVGLFLLLFSANLFADINLVGKNYFWVTWQYCLSESPFNCSTPQKVLVAPGSPIKIPENLQYDMIYASFMQSQATPTYHTHFTKQQCYARYDVGGTLAFDMDYLGNGSCALY